MFPFNALLWRMKYIPRWSLMRAQRQENLCEHTADCAHIAHMLALISREVLKQHTNAENVALAALYHDVSEILTGDMPTPVKYKNPELKAAYKALERQSANSICESAPPQITAHLQGFALQTALSEHEKKLVKAADLLCALIKCTEEERGGNHEFDGARLCQEKALAALQCPEADYFIAHMLPCFDKTLDELV